MALSDGLDHWWSAEKQGDGSGADPFVDQVGGADLEPNDGGTDSYWNDSDGPAVRSYNQSYWRTVATDVLTGREEFTFSAWTRHSSRWNSSLNQVLMGDGEYNTSGRFMLGGINTNNRFGFSNSTTSRGFPLSKDIPATLGTWCHIVMTHSVANNRVWIYQDGSEWFDQDVDNYVGVTIPVVGGIPFVVHRDYYSNGFTTHSSDFGIWNRVLSPAEVTELYNAGRGADLIGTPSGPPPVHPLSGFGSPLKRPGVIS